MTPAQLLGQHLADARRRGEAFDAAWPAATVAALIGSAGGVREGALWRHALTETRGAWEDAWDRREATGPQAALLAVGEAGG